MHCRLTTPVILAGLALSGALEAQPVPPAPRTAPAPPAAPPRAGPTQPARPALERDLSPLPPLVAAMRERILEAARSGDPERMRIAIERNETPPVLLRGRRGDAVALLKEKSADPDGRDILARLIGVLEAPHARLHPGRPQEMFVWPGHAERDLAALTPEEIVELLRAVPYAVLRDSLDKKAYQGDRIGIGPDGTWHYFITGP